MAVEWTYFDCSVDTLHNKRAQWPHHADSWLTWDWTHCGIWSTYSEDISLFLNSCQPGWSTSWLRVLYSWSRYAVIHKCIQKILSGNYCTVLSTLLGRALLLLLWLEPPPHFYLNGIDVKLRSGFLCWEKGPEFIWIFNFSTTASQSIFSSQTMLFVLFMSLLVI